MWKISNGVLPMGQRYISFQTHLFLCSLSVSIKTNSFLMTGHMVCGILLMCNILSANNFKTLQYPDKERVGVAIYVGCNRSELKDPRKPPKGAKGPIVISGAHRFLYVFYHLL